MRLEKADETCRCKQPDGRQSVEALVCKDRLANMNPNPALGKTEFGRSKEVVDELG